MAVKAYLSRQYVYIPFTTLEGFSLNSVTYARVAFKADPNMDPVDADWVTPIIVGDNTHSLWVKAGSVPAFAVLVGPARGDVVTTKDLAAGDYQVWFDLKPPTSDERPAASSGVLTVRAGA